MRRLCTLVTLAAALVLAACGGGSEGGDGRDAQGDVAVPDASSDDARPDLGGDTLADVPAGETLVLEFVSAGDVSVVENSSYDLQVRAYYTPSYAFAVGVPITLSLAGEGDAQLTVAICTTDDNGMCEAGFHSGSTVGAVYTLTASADGAASISQTLTVVGMATGTLIVTPALQFAPQGGETLTLWLVPGTYICGQTGPLDKPTDTHKELQVTDLVTPLTIEALPEAPRWAVVALVTRADGNPLAGGCVDDFAILAEGEPTEVTLDLAKLDLNATGTYAFTATTSLAPWIDPGLAEIPAHLQAHFTADTLAQTLHDGFFAALDAKVHNEHAGYKPDLTACPEDTCDGQQWCIDLIHQELDQSLAQHLANLPQPWDQLADFYDVATALASKAVLSGQVEVKAHVFAPPAHYEYEVRPLLLSLPDCGAASCQWTAEALKSVQFGMEWGDPAAVQGVIVDTDKLSVDVFPLALDPNRVALLVLTDVLGPQAFGTSALLDWFDARFACDTLAPMFSGAFRTCTWSGAEDFAAICADLVDGYNQPLKDWLLPLATQRVPELGQSLVGHDPDGNLELDSADGTLIWSLPGVDALEGTLTWERP